MKMRRMNEMLRHAPDYFAERGFLVEVMGLGRDDILKIKPPKYEAWSQWNKVQPLCLFVYSSSRDRWLIVGWAEIKKIAAHGRKVGPLQFNDGNAYWPIPWELLADLSIADGEG